jgi:spermidine synthase
MSKKNRPELVEFEAPWTFGSGVVRMPNAATVDDVDDLLKGTNRNKAAMPYIVEDRVERRLHFTRHATQSVMLVDDPDTLVTDYTRKMMSFLLFNPNPKHILMIGLGGGSLAKFCYRHLRNTKITAVEVNEEVIALRDEFSVPKDDARFHIVHDDGAHYMEQLEDSVDVMLVDAFDADGIAPSLSKSNFYSRAAEQLTSRGMLIMNLLGQGGRYVENIRAIREAFQNHILLVPVMSSENVLLFAARRPPSQLITLKLETIARRLQSQLQLDFPRYLRRICQGHSLVVC